MSKEEIHLFAAGPLSQDKTHVSQGLLEGKLGLLKDVKVQLETRLGRCEMSLSALNGLKEGEVLALDRAPGDPVEILLGGQVVARGSLVVAGDYFGIRVEEIASLRS
jgi:flagellar motor switch protein FliN/FliY